MAAALRAALEAGVLSFTVGLSGPGRLLSTGGLSCAGGLSTKRGVAPVRGMSSKLADDMASKRASKGEASYVEVCVRQE